MADPEKKPSYTAESQTRHASLRVKHRGKPVTNDDLAVAIYGLRDELAAIIGRAASRAGRGGESVARSSTGSSDAILAEIANLRSSLAELGAGPQGGAGATPANRPVDGSDAADLKQELLNTLKQEIAALRGDIAPLISGAVAVATAGGDGPADAGDAAAAAPDIAKMKQELSECLKQEIAALRGDMAPLIAGIVAVATGSSSPATQVTAMTEMASDGNAGAEVLPDESTQTEAASALTARAQAAFDENFNAQDVRLEIAQMVRTIARAKNEIAAISQPTSDDDDRLDRASNELDAIVTATETATRDILMANEEIGSLVDQIGTAAGDNTEITGHTERIAELLITIFEACSFQDITGQRITKVVRTLQFIQDRILAMIEIWGVEAFADLPVSLPGQDDDEDDESKLLNGPQLENEGITQAEIDALFD